MRFWTCFAGGLIGGLFCLAILLVAVAFAEYQTIIAGVLALLGAAATVFAIRHQANRATDDAHRVAIETKNIVNDLFDELFNELNQEWRMLEVSLNAFYLIGDRELQFHSAHSMIKTQLEDFERNRIGDLVENLLPLDKAHCTLILNSLRHVRQEVNRPPLNDASQNHYEMKAARIGMYLSHLEKFARGYSKELADIFNERQKYPVKHEPFWPQLRASHDKEILEMQARARKKDGG